MHEIMCRFHSDRDRSVDEAYNSEAVLQRPHWFDCSCCQNCSSANVSTLMVIVH